MAILIVLLSRHIAQKASLVTDRITDKAAYLREATKKCLLFLPISLVLYAIDYARIYNTHIILHDDAIHLHTGFKLPMEVD